jgi:hypothetical protein
LSDRHKQEFVDVSALKFGSVKVSGHRCPSAEAHGFVVILDFLGDAMDGFR